MAERSETYRSTVDGPNRPRRNECNIIINGYSEGRAHGPMNTTYNVHQTKDI